MASILSLVLAALVAGTIFNFVDEWNYGLKPFRPINSLITEAPEWFGIYCLAGAVGGASLLLNVWLYSWLCVLLVTVVAFAISLWMICTEPGITTKSYVELAKDDAGDIVAWTLLGFCSSALTLGFLSLIGV